MPSIFLPFDEAVRLSRGATSRSEALLLRDRWWGWISHGKLHVRTDLRKATRTNWSFPIKEHAGRRLFLKETLTEAFAFARDGARNPLEAAVIEINPLVRIERSPAVSCIWLESSLESPTFFSVQGDGAISKPNTTPGDRVLRPGESWLVITGGTFGLQWRNCLPDHLIYVTEVDQTRAPTLIWAERALLWLRCNPIWSRDDHLRALTELSILHARGSILPAVQQEMLRQMVTAHLDQVPAWMKTVVIENGTLPDLGDTTTAEPPAYPSRSQVDSLMERV